MVKNSATGKVIAGVVVGLICGGVGASTVTNNNYKKELAKHKGDYLLEAVAWQQNSGECEALRHQAYNVATQNLLNDVKTKSDKPKAVILDIDETVVDNSPHSGYMAKTGNSFTMQNFNDWTKLEAAKPIAGAKKFLDTAQKNDVQAFYVSNRDEKDQLADTIANLKKDGLPYADKDHVLLVKPGEPMSKNARWQEVAKNYDVLMYVGDNLNDFSKDFEKKSNADRKGLVDKDSNDFGSKYIMLPNASYGDFEGAIYNYNYKLSQQQKYDAIRSAVQGFE